MKLILFSGILSLCSGTLQRRIIDGKPSTAKDWMVHLKSKTSIFCGGTAITESLVLTTVRCNQGYIEDWRAYLGIDRVEPVLSSIPGKRVLLRCDHPDYDEKQFDISAWWIDGESNDRTEIILDEGKEFERGDSVNVLGWGNINLGSAVKDLLPNLDTKVNHNLHEATIPLINAKVCEKNCRNWISSSDFCTGGDRPYSVMNKGDTGGPVYRVIDGKPILMGIFSRSGLCNANPNYVSFNVKISLDSVHKFIKHYQGYFKPQNLVDKVPKNIPRFVSKASSLRRITS